MRKRAIASLSVALAAAAAFAAPSRAQSLEALSAQSGLTLPSRAAFQAQSVPAVRATIQSRVSPNWTLTPGKLCTTSDPDFKEFRYPEHIAYCQRNVNHDKKLQVAASYGVPESDWPNYEFDHLLPLAIGGSSDAANIWPQPHGSDNSNGKDVLEYQLYKEMAAGTVTQADAVKEIYAWFGGSQLQAQAALAPAAKSPAPAAR
ncbi:MAG: hypothetical protein KGL53_01630 [Elusimicrobia bacterium]|nr:hypothetical protein [Elusimicrobiota bacterium]